MKCQSCGGEGWLIMFEELAFPVLERCDDCQKFKGDLHAAFAYFKSKRRKFDLKCVELKRKETP